MKKLMRQHIVGFAAGILFSGFLAAAGCAWLIRENTAPKENTIQHPITIMRNADAKQYWIIFDDDNFWHFDRDVSKWNNSDPGSGRAWEGGWRLRKSAENSENH